MSWRVSSTSNQTLWLRLALVGGLAALGLLIAIIIFIVNRPSTTPSLSLTPTAGPPGTTIVVRGQHWPVNQALTINLGRPNTPVSEEMGAIWSAPDGTFSFELAFPTSGVWTTLPSVDVLARSLDGQTTGRATFTVQPSPGGGIVQPTASRSPGAPSATPAIGTPPAVTRPAATAAAAATATPVERIRVVGMVQSLTLDLDGLVINPLDGAIREILTGTNTTILDEAGRTIPLDEVPIGAVVEAEGNRAGDQLRAERVQVRAQPPTPRATLTPLPPSPTITAPPTQTPRIIVVTATPLPPTATGQPTLTPTPTPTPPVITAWRGEYYPNRDLSGAPLFVRDDDRIDFVWLRPPRSPDGRDLPDPWSARWTRRLRFDSGWYRFRAQADDGVRVWIDGNLIIDEWHPSAGNTVYEQIVRLGTGSHSVQVEYFQAGGGASILVTWEPSSFSGWRGEYWTNPNLAGASELVRNEDRVFFDWSSGRPDPRMPTDNWSARYTRRLAFEAGTHRFTVTVDDGARLWVDGTLIIDAWRDQGVTTLTADLTLTAGEHDVRLDYYNRTGRAVIQLGWTRLVPTPTLLPTFTATVITFPTATRTFTPTPSRTPTVTITATAAPATATRTVTVQAPTGTPTATGVPATPTTTGVPLTPTATGMPATPTPTVAPATATVTATSVPPTATRTATVRPTLTIPPGIDVRPWQAADFPLAPLSDQLESHTGRIANLVWSGAPPRCFAFELIEGSTTVTVIGHSEAVQTATGLGLNANQFLSPVCTTEPPIEGMQVRVWGTRTFPGGPLAALRVEAAGRPSDPVLGQTAYYERRFILDSEFDEAGQVLVNTTLWIRTTVATAPTLVQDSSRLSQAFQARGLRPDASILLRGEIPQGASVRLESVTAWLFNGVDAYSQVYPAP